MPRTDYSEITLDDLDGRSFALVGETAAILELDPRTVITAIQRGDIPSTRVGQQYRIPTAWLRAAAAAGDAA